MWTKIIFAVSLIVSCQANAPNPFLLNNFYPIKVVGNPTQSEAKVCTPIRDVIKRNTARYRKVLVINRNNDIVFGGDDRSDSAHMTSRAKSKLDVLATRVKSEWSGWKLYVYLAWTDNLKKYNSTLGILSMHYEGRALKVRVTNNDGVSFDQSKLGRLAKLAVDSGFDFVHYVDPDNVYISVKPDVCQTKVDLGLVIDTSGSVNYDDFTKKIKPFLKNMVDFYNVGSNQTRIGLISYSYTIRREFAMNKYFTRQGIKNGIDSMYYEGSMTNTGGALKTLKDWLFTTGSGMRDSKSIPKIGILLTDGFSNTGPSIVTESQAVRDAGISLFAIGVGVPNANELNAIASDPDSTHVFRLNNFQDLSGFVDQISTVSCDEGAQVSKCQSAETSVDGGSFKYFRGKFSSSTTSVTVEVEDLQGKSFLYTSLTSTNPGPLDENSVTQKNTNPASPRVLSVTLSATKLVYISVQGQEDNNKFKINIWDAIFSQTKFTLSVSESKQTSRAITTITKSASVTGNFKYSISSGNEEGNFRMDENTGVVTLIKSLDRERKDKYTLVIKGQDALLACHQGRTLLEITVTDDNDHDPKFSLKPYTATIDENAGVGTLVVTLSATDQDIGDNAKLTYSIVSGAGKDFFTINPSTGKITLAKKPDYETRSQYTLGLKVEDGGKPSPRSDTTNLQVRITDVNEAPYFKAPCATSCQHSIQEGPQTDRQVTQVTAGDPDTAVTCTLTYSIISSDKTYFKIDSTGTIKTKTAIDRELKDVYSLKVQAADCASPPLTSVTTVTVTAQDINDNKPKFQTRNYVASVAENKNSGTQVIQVSATDADTGTNGQITYSITDGNSRNAFTINPNNGWITTAAKLDRETTPTYNLTIEAKDSGSPSSSSTATLVVSVQDENDNAPEFTGPKNFRLDENVGSGTDVAAIQTSDKDQGLNAKVRCKILSGNDGLVFTMDSSTCTIKTSGTIDREHKSTYAVKIEASDIGNPVKKTTDDFTITINDLNDNSPVFTESLYRGTVKENAAVDTSIVKVKATDLDAGTNKAITYSIESGNVNNVFGINGTSGEITLKGQLKFGERSSYELKVKAKDGGLTPRSSTSIVKITVEDTNDFAPVFKNLPYTANVSENVAKGFDVLTVKATDEDSGPSGVVTYSITSNPGNKFKIDSNSGLIETNGLLDYEALSTKSYTITVQARDSGTQSKAATADVVINILDLNDNPPVFSKTKFELEVFENATTGVVIGEVTATDADSNQNAVLTYEFLTPNTPISITPDGKVKVSGSLDRETTDSYDITVRVTDGGSPSESSTSQVAVKILDSNDNAPVIKGKPLVAEVFENSAAQTNVKFIDASDADEGDNSKLTYSLTPASGSSFPFEIDSNGQVKTTSKKDLNRETQGQYKGTVTVTDRGFPSLFDSAEITINVKDENDNFPVFNASSYTFNIEEEQTSNLRAGTVLATDADAGVNGEVKYSIVGGNSGNRFTIDEATGLISAKDKLDRETKAKYTLKVRAEDKGNPKRSAEVFVDINVSDVNDNDPTFNPSSYHIKIKEDAGVGSRITEVSASDADATSNADITYSIDDHLYKSNFTIDPKKGLITTGAPLDFETVQGYNLTITATDGGSPSRSAKTVVYIQVENVDDNPPEFGKVSQVNVREGVGVGTDVVSFNATDKDGGTLTYSITGGNVGFGFDIDSTTGVLKTASELDRETTPFYNLTVQVTDRSNQKTTTYLGVLIDDVNDNAPKFVKEPYKGQILENQGTNVAVLNDLGSAALKVNATDKDDGTNAEIEYSILSGDDGNDLQIDPITGEIKARKDLDREKTPNYQLVVAAKDKGNPSLRSTVKVDIKVLDENDNPPAFEKDSYDIKVQENSGTNFTVTTMRASDPDAGSNAEVTFSIVSENGGSPNAFNINPSTGVVETLINLDRETQESYHLRVKASDKASTPKFAVTDLNITVLDENDNQPEFKAPESIDPVEEGSLLSGNPITTFSAADKDIGTNAELVYKIVSGNRDGMFELDSKSGALTLKKKLDRETKAQYVLEISASDKGTPPFRKTKKFTVPVKDVNDNKPEFTKDKYEGSVKENVDSGTPVVTVTATDADVGDNAVVRYSIQNNNNLPFTINTTTGEISTSGDLDYETKTEYSFNVTASDGDSNTVVPVKIAVENLNDNAPKFISEPYHTQVLESETPGRPVFKVSAKDKDSFGGLHYSLVNGTDIFSMNQQSGEIKLSKPLDRETKNSYVVIVNATDNGNPSKTTTAMVRFTVGDVNDNAPKFENNTATVSVTENGGADAFVIDVKATDADSGDNGKVEYEIVPGKGSGDFKVDKDTGRVLTAKSLDRENHPSYKIRIIAKDRGSPEKKKSLPFTLTVKVEDKNDNKPEFQNTPYNQSVPEGSDEGHIVMGIQAIDKDIGTNGDVKYVINGGNDEGKFSIDYDTGVITVNGTLDREIREKYDLTVRASDSGNPIMSTDVNVIIYIADINDNAPLFEGVQNITISENKFPGTTVSTIKATDKDIGENGRVTYSVNNNDAFTIEADTGVIKTLKALDREEKLQYELEITATDHGSPPLSTKKTVYVTVKDEDDNCPIFNPQTYHAEIREHAAVGTTVLTVTASDKDQGPNAILNYAIKAGDDGGALDVNSKTGVITVHNSKKLDREYKTEYTLLVRAGAEDCGVPPDNNTVVGEGGSDRSNNQSIANVRITLTDINDNSPVFQKTSYRFTFNDAKIKTPLGDVVAKDPDTGDGGKVKYRLRSTKRVEDTRTNKVKHELRIEAYDQGIPRKSFTKTVTVLDERYVNNVYTPCQAMVFQCSEAGSVTVSTLCGITKLPSSPITILVGEALKLTCEATGNKDIEYRWIKDSSVYSDWSKTGALTVSQATKNEHGGYACIVRNLAGNLQSQVITVNVEEKPKIITHPKSTAAEVNGQASFTCEATGDPAPTYQWYRDDNPIYFGDGYNTNKLTLKKITKGDSNSYHCEVKNSHGTAKSNKAQLTVYESNKVVKLKVTINNPNENNTCHYYSQEQFRQLIQDLIKRNVDVTKMDKSQFCTPTPCGPNPCKNGATCNVVNKEKFKCSCNDGWRGNVCSEDIDECKATTGTCQNGKCVNKPGTYICQCPAGWKGQKCEDKIEVCKPNPCRANEDCTPDGITPKCIPKKSQLTTIITLVLIRYTICPNLRPTEPTCLFQIMKYLNKGLSRASSQTKRTRRDTSASGGTDLSSCKSVILNYTIVAGQMQIRWGVVCPEKNTTNTTGQTSDICKNLMTGNTGVTGCGSSGRPLTTAAPKKKLPPAVVPVEVVIKDNKTGKAVNAKTGVEILKNNIGDKLKNNSGINITDIGEGYDRPVQKDGQKEDKTNVALIVGIVCGVAALIIIIILIVFFVTRKRNKGSGEMLTMSERAAIRHLNKDELLRSDIGMTQVDHNGSVTNYAYDTDSPKNMSSFNGGEDSFMFKIPDNVRDASRKRRSLITFPWYKGELKPEQAEKYFEFCNSPGSYIAYRSVDEKIYLAVKFPDGGPSVRHLEIAKSPDGSYIAKFGDADPVVRETMQDVIDHFQIVPISFGDSVPETLLTEPWLKTAV